MCRKCVERLYICIELLTYTIMANVSAFLKPTKGKPTTKVRFYVSRGRSEPRLFYTSDIEINAEYNRAWTTTNLNY